MTYLPDVNVWIAFAVEGYIHHRPAKEWFDETETETGRIAFRRMTEIGLLRLLTNASVMGGSALSRMQKNSEIQSAADQRR